MTNEEIDGKVLEAIRLGKNRCIAICGHVMGDYRAVDRSLQRLRKRGDVRYTSKDGWSVPKGTS